MGGPKFRSFFHSLATIFIISSLLGVLALNFGGVLKRRVPEMCTFGVLGLSCEAPAAPKPRRLHTTARAQTCTFQGPGLQNTSKIQRKEREERKTIVAGEGKKSEILGGPAEEDA